VRRVQTLLEKDMAQHVVEQPDGSRDLDEAAKRAVAKSIYKNPLPPYLT